MCRLADQPSRIENHDLSRPRELGRLEQARDVRLDLLEYTSSA